MKPLIVSLSYMALVTTTSIPMVSAEPQQAASVTISKDLKIESSRSTVIELIHESNTALQKQKACVVKAQKKLAAFAVDQRSKQEYIDAKRGLETDLALMKIMTDRCLEKIKELEVIDWIELE